MLRPRHFWSVHAVVGALMFGQGCDRIGGGSPERKDERFELKQDGQGRLIRLDKVTGELAIIQGSTFIPITSSVDASRSRQSGAQIEREAAPVSGTHTKVSLSDSVENTSALRAARRSEPEIIAIHETSPVFAAANRTGRPLVLAAKGSRFRVLASQADWYRIEFDDAQLGHRVGYVEKKFTDSSPVSESSMQPVDVSITPNVNAPRTEPVDLSIPDLKPRQEPVDVSIPPQ